MRHVSAENATHARPSIALKPSFRFALWQTAALAAIFFVFSGCYYAKQGTYALRYQWRATSNKKLLADTTTPQDLKKFLMNVESIRAFAFDSLGLKRNKNYSTFVAVDKKYLIDNVYAARADTFAQYYWRYPFLGAMPYKGFFKRPDAEKEAGRLQKKGYDVFIGEVSGYSSLGFATDPVYSFMKNYGPYSLANFIVHELTHATIYAKNQSQFNEETASFIGMEAALRYTAGFYGADTGNYRKTLLSIDDYGVYLRLMNGLCRRLDSAYRSIDNPVSRVAAKNEIIAQFKSTVQTKYDSLFKTKRYSEIAKAPFNNASIMIHMTYSKDLDLYYALYRQCGSDLRATIAELKKVAALKGDAKENLRKRIAGQPGSR